MILCNNKGILFSDHNTILNSITDENAKDKYLENLNKMNTQQFNAPSYVTEIAHEGIKIFQENQKKSAELIKKYAEGKDQVNAKKAFELFQDTMKSADDDNIKLLKVSFQNVDNFVDSCVTGCKNDPDFINNFKQG